MVNKLVVWKSELPELREAADRRGDESSKGVTWEDESGDPEDVSVVGGESPLAEYASYTAWVSGGEALTENTQFLLDNGNGLEIRRVEMKSAMDEQEEGDKSKERENAQDQGRCHFVEWQIPVVRLVDL